MKIKLISFIIVLICLLCVLCAGVFSVHRSEGVVISPENKVKIEAFFDQHGIDFELPAILTE